MRQSLLTLVFMVYGLAFFSMGLVVYLERGRGSEGRLRRALPQLAAFGLLHGVHEWLEMFKQVNLLPAQDVAGPAWEGLRLAILAFSFLSLGAFGASLLAPTERVRRISLLLPVAQVAIWAIGLMVLRGRYPAGNELLDVADVWARYVLGIPGSLVAAVGLVAQQRTFRRAGMAQFGRDTLWAAAAFAWYGLVGQLFTRQSLLPPSTTINQELFFQMLGFPVQLLRATAAGAAAIFVIRSLRAFDVETQRKISQLQAAQLEEAQHREALRGELLRRVVAAQEAERQRVARELHDETGQALTAIGLGLRGVSTTLSHNSDVAAQNLRRLEKLVDRSLDELQRLIADLRPSHLDDLGLPATLRWWAGEVQKRADLAVKVEVSGEERPLAAPLRIALFRVAQEALTNVIKHADATAARLQLHFGSDSVVLTVEDDGRGFDVGRMWIASGRPAWGLLGMRERASLLGGRFDLDSAPGRGTCVQVAIPYQPEAQMTDSELSNGDPAVIG